MVVPSLLALLHSLALSALAASITEQTNVSCIGAADGALTVTATGGLEPYTYEWSPGAPVGDGTPTISMLTTGAYSVVVTDAAAASVAVDATITRWSNLSMWPLSQQNVTCFGGANGTAAVLPPTGGFGLVVVRWSPGDPIGDGTAQVSSLTAGMWTAVATDSLGCTATVDFFVLQPPAVVVAPLAQTPVSCAGGSDGSASASAPTGGTPPYSLNWSPGNPVGEGTTTASGLDARAWTLTAVDSNGCQGATTFTISEPEPLALTATVDDVRCAGADDGRVAVEVTGGNGGYTYAWSPGDPTGEGSAEVTALSPGVWSVAVTDSRGCTAGADFTVAEPEPLGVAPLTQTDARCYGGSDGSAAIAEPTGGVPPYRYDWGPRDPPGEGTQAVSGLSAGPWRVVVSDGNGCSVNEDFTIGEGNEISLAVATQAPLSCLGAADGAISIAEATGGAGGFQYDWEPGAPMGDGTLTVSGLRAGTYTVTATDAQQCSRALSLEVTGPTVLALAPLGSNPRCAGSADGAATVQVTGGRQPYSYAWQGAEAADEAATQLAAGAYSVTVTDADGCYATAELLLTDPPALLANGSSRGVSAVGACDAEAHVAPTGGTPPYATTWTPSGETNAALSARCAGAVAASVSDANGCQAVFSADLGADTSDLSVTLDADVTEVSVGATLVLRAVVGATPPAVGAQVAMTLPEALSLAALRLPEGWSCAPEETLRCSSSGVLSEASLELELVVTAAGGEALVLAEITAPLNDPDASNNRASWRLPALAPASGCGGCQGGDAPAAALAVLMGLGLFRRRERQG